MKNQNTQVDLNRTLKRFKHPKVYSTLGCHPHFADRWTESLENLILNALKDSDIHKIVAIGECGLDSSRKYIIWEIFFNHYIFLKIFF